MGSAYVNHLDAATGSIEVGKYADLAVLDQNLFEIPAIEMPEGAAWSSRSSRASASSTSRGLHTG